jgi:2-polyprenyl-3-methyl-5-hydroxy-6-metoxy-1,4-benzoquinol methylase
MNLFEKTYFKDKKIFGDYENRVKLFKGWKKIIKIVKQQKESGNLLDIGCAYGHLINSARDNFNVYGMDVSSYAIKKAKEIFELKNIKKGDVQTGIPFNKKFDVITAIDVIEHLNNPVNGLRNIYSKLKKDGLFIIQLPTVNNWLSKVINKYLFPDKTHVFIPSLDKLNKILKKIGYKKIVTRSYYSKTKNDLIVKSLCLIIGVYKK